MRSASSDAEFKPHKDEKWYPKEVWEAARLKAATKGGEAADYLDECVQALKAVREPREFNDSELRSAGFKPVQHYPYVSRTGAPLYESVRYQHPDVPNAKQFRQRRKGKDGKWFADAGLVKVPYRWPEMEKRKAEILYYVEGEKDADTLHSEGLLATTMAGQQWSPEGAKAFIGRDVVIIGDHDDAGREHVRKAVEALTGFAASIRVVELPGLSRTQDVTDWLKAGHSKDDLLALVEKARPTGIRLKPAPFLKAKDIPTRRWVYRPHYIRQFVSLLISTGGIGKSSLAIVEALALVSGEPLLGMTPQETRVRAWYWNGEDPLDELQRRVAAAIKRHDLTIEEIGERLFISSGRDMPIVLAEEDKRGPRLNQSAVDEVIENILRNRIDVVIVDPFVSTHRVNENDNGAIDLVAKTWNRIAEVTNCAVLLVHHSRKPRDGELTVDDTRGASALLAAARSARIINRMTKKEAEDCNIEENERHTYFASYNGKSNLAKPAEHRDWYRLVSVDLENGRDLASDEVGVVTPWQYPKVELPEMTPASERVACDLIRKGGRWRFSSRSKIEPWVGKPIAQALGADLSNSRHKKHVEGIVEAWLSAGRLRRVGAKDENGDNRPYVTLADPAPTVGREGRMGDSESADV